MFISNAFAQTAPVSGTEAITGFLPLILIVGIFYLLIWKPQRKQAMEHQEMIANLKRGDVIVTSGGLEAEITKVEDTTFNVKFAGGEAVLHKQYVSALVAKGVEKKNTEKDVKPAKKTKAKK